MLRLAILFAILALLFGVMGFGGAAAIAWDGARIGAEDRNAVSEQTRRPTAGARRRAADDPATGSAGLGRSRKAA